MSLTYTTYTEALSTLTVISSTDTEFVAILPSVIDYAEGRIYRELTMLVEDVADSSGSTVALTRGVNIPTAIGRFQVVTGVNVITPASTAPDSGTRNPCTPVSRAYLDRAWPSTTGATVPTDFCYASQASAIGTSGQPDILFGPWPDTTYRVEVVGKVIPTPLSASNPTTFLSLYLPDLFLMASQLYMVGPYMKNIGMASDDPKSTVHLEAQYQALLKSAGDWEARKRFASGSWTSAPIEPMALPQRG
jgi:hypothetical protein